MAETKNPKVIVELAKATGVAEADVAKVLNQLGLDRIQAEAVRAHHGEEPGLSMAKVAYKIGKSTIIV
ncbi:MAG: hypothetical protein ABSH01_22010 [Terriglobia bacterium]|jgi:hypothetical protein